MVRPEDVLEQMEKILRSKGFASSGRLSRFMRFTIGEALDGRASGLKEYVVGVQVFDRKPSYDPRTEPIVRVEARRLRSKLAKYYSGEGAADPVRIEYPLGSYTPVFHAGEESALPAPAESAIHTVAVLPFVNLSADPENEYFSDGLTEELINELTKLKPLRVVAWSSAFQFKARPRDLQQIGERLRVRSILEGSVRRSGDRLRITAQLVDVATGFYLWSEAFERPMKDIFAIQEEISRAIAQTLRVRLGGDLPVKTPRLIEAYNAYLLGRFHWNKRSVPGIEKAIECFERAISIDARYAPAYAGLADAHSILGGQGMAPPAERLPVAKRAALRALELEETLSEAHASLALVLAVYDHDWRGAERHFDRAIELNPGYATARHWSLTSILRPSAGWTMRWRRSSAPRSWILCQ